METTQFWEARAQRFAARGKGLKAVCSYAMPEFYNRAIDWTQRAALRDVVASVKPGMKVLDFGCGVGRWSVELAARGAEVTAIDFSPTMLAEAARRIERAGAARRCKLIAMDVAKIDLAERFDLILGVTVLQHVLDAAELSRTIAGLAAHLRPAGRLVMVEAAPGRADTRCDTPTFRARTLDDYVANIEAAGLTVASVRGVDPAPFKLWVVPRFRTWPRPLAVAALALATLVALPVDLLLARPLTRHSWHKLVVAAAPGVSV